MSKIIYFLIPVTGARQQPLELLCRQGPAEEIALHVVATKTL